MYAQFDAYINEDNIHKFKKYRYSWFQISIDGSRPEIHNYIRGAKAFEKAINAADCIKKAGIPLAIAHAVMKPNLDYIEEMIDVAYLMGAVRIVLGPFGYMGRAILNSDSLALSEDEIKDVYKRTESKAMHYKKLMKVVIPMEEVFNLRKRLLEPNRYLLIRPNGDVKYDCVSPFKIGNVRTESLADIWNKGKIVHMHERLYEYSANIKSYRDLEKVVPRINVDPDELLVF